MSSTDPTAVLQQSRRGPRVIRRAPILGTVLVFSWQCSVGPSTSPVSRVIDDNAECPQCRIEFREVALLGDSLDDSSPRPDAAGRECMVGRLSTGEYVVSGIVGGGQINVYDAAGHRVRTIGRKGAGPGELGNSVRLMVGPGDTLIVLDESNLRLQTLTSSGDYVRSFPTPVRVRSIALLPGGNLLYYRSPTRADDRLFHLVSPNGTEVAQFGKTTGVPLDIEMWTVSPARPTGFWTSSYWNYELNRWRAVDTLAQALIRHADWFPVNAPYPDNPFRTALPPPALIHIGEDSSGRVWTYSLVPDPNWKPGGSLRPSPEWFRSTYDTVIEVIDPRQARLITSARHDTKLGVICGSALLYTVVETPSGDTRVQILEPVLVEPSTATSK